MITHPVRVTPDALKDLLRLYRQDPQILRAALQKIRLLESNPYAGRPLLGDLAGCRKLVVGDRTWRIVWRVLTDAEGNTSIEISEVLAIGARENNRVYEEARKRLERMEPSEAGADLADLLRRFGMDSPTQEPSAAPPEEPVPGWLRERLLDQAGLPADKVAAMSLREAVDAWTAWTARPRG
ncbi:type II toxin-antitoxin system RelE/ParE family toxin [Streptomyces sp. BV333]|uniref:type II toxin-antitoxin system RelE family toxin n=1 Tax=Streptomyces sp. BV333 TaxID=2849673 RepID=UPI001C2EDB0F|nr:type II toxin-antitoxin system RelE/ParE family toxin [Streptomyces sp. BV333]MBV1953344.1 type II toxin-antitoxin system RelE/ParE family toxin [Streptomyces sp. BV333]